MTRTLRHLARSIIRRDRYSTHRRAWRPEPVAALEARALLTASPVVSTFNGGQPLVTPLANSTTTASIPAAAAVQRDGRIVTVGFNDPKAAVGPIGPPASDVYVTRTNADGTPDTSFGTNGQVAITLPTTARRALARDVLTQPDGGIVLVVNQINYLGSLGKQVTTDSLVIRLTSTGALDSTFGTNGQVDLTGSNIAYSQLALQSDGGIVLAGVTATTTLRTDVTTVTRLTTTGAVDPSFHGGTPALLNATAEFSGVSDGSNVLDMAMVNGAIRVITTGSTLTSSYVVSQLTSAGVLDNSFGTGGTVTSPSPLDAPLTTARVLTDGSILMATSNSSTQVTTDSTGPLTSTLLRLNADGSPDSGFRVVEGFQINSLAGTDDGSILAAGGSFPAVVLSVARLHADGSPDLTFGPGGIARLAPSIPAEAAADGGMVVPGVAAVIPLTNGQVVAVGFESYFQVSIGSIQEVGIPGAQAVIGVLGATNRLSGMNNDYDGDNRSDLAAELTQYGAFAYRPSTGTGDVVQPFGQAGAGLTVPAPGDYDGDGRADVAAYLPALGITAIRPSSGGPDVFVRFGPTGVGSAIPVPGDYDGDGKTDVALFLPDNATFIIAPSSGAHPYAVQFGSPGAGTTIPLVGDFDGSGRTELGAYFPATGQFVFRSNLNGGDFQRTFGPSGVGASIPLAGDYNGDGLTDLALYLPNGTFAILPSDLDTSLINNPFRPAPGVALSGTPYAVSFGAAGVGQSVPLSGDFDGDGKADLAVFLPAINLFATRPSSGGNDVYQAFGSGGSATVPAAAPPGLVSNGTVTAQALAARAADPNAGLVFFLPDDAPGRKKPTT